MPRGSSERTRLRRKRSTRSTRDFAKMRRYFPQRLTIVSDGDSWFAYPPEWLPVGGKSNLVDYLTRATRNKANFLDMASNGDEAVDILSGAQKHRLIEQLRWHEKNPGNKPVDLLLISAGGNDVVGENDFERFIKPYRSRHTRPEHCIHKARLKRKIQQVALAYEELLDIRDQYSATTLVMTHCYDYPPPSLRGAEFWGGLYQTAAWMKPYMLAAGIPERLHEGMVRYFMDALAEGLLRLQARRSGFVAVDTRNTLKNKDLWVNEIHPSSKGFELIAAPIIAEMRARFTEL